MMKEEQLANSVFFSGQNNSPLQLDDLEMLRYVANAMHQFRVI